ncbi:MAG: hypothetical protein LUI14_07975 [Lachnospiraceae bacterium]|nr:hypothetical protein [Lachnospiraceae bacterium]
MGLNKSKKKIDEIINEFKTNSDISCNKAVRLNAESKYLNRDVLEIYEKYTEMIENILVECRAIDEHINQILACPGCFFTITKYHYLISKKEVLSKLNNDRITRIQSISKIKIRLFDDKTRFLSELRNAFNLLLESHKCVSDRDDIHTFICKDVPKELDIFEFDTAPVVVYIKEFYYCLFGEVILVFDKNGMFSTALEPSSLDIEVAHKMININVCNNTVAYHPYVSFDSKCLKKGEVTWGCSKDIYEYGVITIGILNNQVSFRVSSCKAVSELERIKDLYIKGHNYPENSIKNLFLLLKMVSDMDNTIINSLLKQYAAMPEHLKRFCQLKINGKLFE